VSLSDALKEYISKNYDQHPDMFKEDLQTIDKLRVEAVTSLEPHVSGVKKISSYAAQLIWIGGKFPIDIGVEFSWYPALGFNVQSPISESNLRFELANVLFNLAALYSQLALSLNRTTSEGLKAANNYLCHGAGVLEYLRTEIIPDMQSPPPEDMDEMTLESLQQLLLAQAQECSWSMAIKNDYRDALIAKLAAKVSDFYDQAAEYGTRSDTVSTEWIHHMSAKHHHFAAAAQYRAACDCLEKRKYGEEVARLRDSLVCVNEALKESKWVNKVVLADLNGLKAKVTDDLKRAEKDNDVIYLADVPTKSQLKTLDRASMAVAKKPTDISDPSSSLGDKGAFGQPLFVRLVPYSVHVAASIYADRRDRLVNTQIIDQLEILNNKLRE
jgi:programmed cell death 6-interacting protein